MSSASASMRIQEKYLGTWNLLNRSANIFNMKIKNITVYYGYHSVVLANLGSDCDKYHSWLLSIYKCKERKPKN